MSFLRIAILVGFLLLSGGFLATSVSPYEQVAAVLAWAGIITILISIIAGNWMLSYMEAAKAHGAIYRLVIAGFAVAIVGIVVGEHAATVGNGVTGTGIALIAVGTVMTMLRGRRKE